ncbi:MAG: hypothetical protein JOZ41_11330, partial [Chloroflexi bacterium]|nr:hypothetical protein [Chloroflexota bacterium]
MSDEERDIPGLSDAEEELARRLVRLGPLIREQERTEADMDQAFVRTLRAHLVLGEERAPHPGFARDLRARLMRERTAHPISKPPWPRPIAWIAAATGTLLALVVGLLVAVLGSQHAHAPAF